MIPPGDPVKSVDPGVAVAGAAAAALIGYNVSKNRHKDGQVLLQQRLSI